jgi:hypothetical protein
MEKRGAIELSLSTIVVIVLAIAFLIFGLVLLRNISCSAIGGMQKLDDYTMKQLRELFTEDSTISIIKTQNEIQRGVNYGVAFAIRNLGSNNNKFSYNVQVQDVEDCKFDKAKAESFMVLGKKADNISISIDKDYAGLVNFEIPSDVENCNVRYIIYVKNGDQDYDSATFDVKIKPKTFTANFC